jgi:arsenite methyltransferase
MIFDRHLAGQLESIYQARDMVRRRQLARDALGAVPGERIADVGCGPGFQTAELLERVGADGRVVGLDSSPAMLAAASARCAGHRNAVFLAADVTSLPVQESGFDAALCVQVLEYVTDVAAALAALHRILRPGGRLVVWDVDWATVSWHTADPARMERVLRAWDGHLAHPSLPRTLASRLRSAGFADIVMTGHPFATMDASPDTFGGSIIPLIEQFIEGRDETRALDARAWSAEQRQLDVTGDFFFSCVQFCFTAVRPGTDTDAHEL